MQEHLPATLPHHQFAVMGSAMGIKGKSAGHREKTIRRKSNKSSQAPREAFISGSEGCFVWRGSSTKCISLKKRDHGINYTGFVRYSVNDNRLLFGVI